MTSPFQEALTEAVRLFDELNASRDGHLGLSPALAGFAYAKLHRSAPQDDVELWLNGARQAVNFTDRIALYHDIRDGWLQYLAGRNVLPPTVIPLDSSSWLLDGQTVNVLHIQARPFNNALLWASGHIYDTFDSRILRPADIRPARGEAIGQWATTDAWLGNQTAIALGRSAIKVAFYILTRCLGGDPLRMEPEFMLRVDGEIQAYRLPPEWEPKN